MPPPPSQTCHSQTFPQPPFTNQPRQNSRDRLLLPRSPSPTNTARCCTLYSCHSTLRHTTLSLRLLAHPFLAGALRRRTRLWRPKASARARRMRAAARRTPSCTQCLSLLPSEPCGGCLAARSALAKEPCGGVKSRQAPYAPCVQSVYMHDYHLGGESGPQGISAPSGSTTALPVSGRPSTRTPE